MKNCLTPKNLKMCDPILVTLLKMWPHYSHSSRENATPSSGTSPLASYKAVPSSVFVFKVVKEKKKYKLKRMDPLAELYITIQRISVRQSNQVIQWIVLSPFWTTGASTLLTDKTSTIVSLFCFLSLKLINETGKNSRFNYSKNTMSLLF